jgi:hypothetical protein
MRVALGLKAHSGWAALVALGERGREIEVIDRRRLELVAPGEAEWARQPYHAAERLGGPAARELVQRGIAAARRHASREIRGAAERATAAGHRVAVCALLTPGEMPGWTVDEILAAHPRMHRAEGAVFRDALARAARASGLALAAIPERSLAERAGRALEAPPAVLLARVQGLGRSVGPPWGKDPKEAALAAMVALRETRG